MLPNSTLCFLRWHHRERRHGLRPAIIKGAQKIILWVLLHLDWVGFCKLALWIILSAIFVNHQTIFCPSGLFFFQIVLSDNFFANCPSGQFFFANWLDDQFFAHCRSWQTLSKCCKIVLHHFSLICLQIIVMDNFFETSLSRQVVRVRVVRIVQVGRMV